MLVKLVALATLARVLTAPIDGDSSLFFRKDYTFIKEQNAFYKFHKVKQNFSDAVTQCSAEGAKLLIPTSQKESEAAYELVRPDVSLLWIGIHDIFGEGSFITLDGDSIEDVYYNWGPGEPNNGGTGEDCVVLRRNTAFNDGTCSTKEHFICKRSLEGLTQNQKCETYDTAYSYLDATDSCYKLHTTPRTWRDAFKICRAEESELAIINSEEEAKYMANEFAKHPDDSLKGNFDKGLVHIGFNDLINEGVHLTIEGKPISETGYEKWGSGQPDNHMGSENCGSMFRDGTLNDVNCKNRAMFFCEKKLSKKVVNVEPFQRVGLITKLVDA